MEETIKEIETIDGVRMTWNVIPNKKTKIDDFIVPVACLYTPLQGEPTLLDYEPVFCTSCRAILNPFSEINYEKRDWTCPLCSKRNMLPNHYREISSDDLPPELISDNTTVEYILTKEANFPPVFVFLIDICTFDEERHKLLMESVKVTFDNLLDDSLVMLVTFGTNIELYDFDSEIKSTYLFSGGVSYQKNIYEKITGKKETKDHLLLGKFIKKKSLVKDYFTRTIEALKQDLFPIADGKRPIRCSGSTISFGVSMAENMFSDTALKFFLFTEGPCTFGPGTIASLSLKDVIRSGDDILKGRSIYTKPAQEFYNGLAKRMSENGYSIDIICATLYDVGLFEMKALTDQTGGIIIMAQDFDSNVLLSSCRKNVEGYIFDNEEQKVLNQCFNAKFMIKTSPGLKWKGVIGQGSSTKQGWKLPSIYKNHNLAILFETEETNMENCFVQIITQYQRSDRKIINRVTTFSRLLGAPGDNNIIDGFDQEAACVLQSRIFTFKAYLDEDMDLIRRIDRSLIKFVRKYGKRTMDDEIDLPDTMSLFAKFMYFLRRSTLVQTQANSPDETIYFRNLLIRERVTEAMTMIVPTLLSFHYQGDIQPVEMDSKSLEPDVILLLDSFHNVLIWKGEHINEWMKEEIHLKEEYAYLKECIDTAEKRANEIVEERLPTPPYVITERHGSQERTLLSKVNPSLKGDVVVTDDIDYDTFYKCMCKIVHDN
ncbi:SEC23 protein [Spraguea lophii 42_110]|uniref:Protein transport protein SEC23 n=1 Tax=Spraguea lophii (strain 42_110) TaxID=1358809 RepID=S7W771_SPRLO|nr:SEC23 protein [Spraguea lophii 42_110]